MATKSKTFSAADKVKRMIIKKTFAVTSSSLPKNIFQKSSFPQAPGGDRYEWKDFDLKTSIHGLKKIEYFAKIARKGSFDVEIALFDIYDFEKKILPLLPFHRKELFRQAAINWIDLWEELGIIENFEVEIHLTEQLNAD